MFAQYPSEQRSEITEVSGWRKDYFSASDPASTEADLSLVQEGGPDDSFDGILDVGVIEDHSSVLTTQLQRDFLQGGRRELSDPLTHLGGT